jgi:hypothetical protein
MRWKSSNAESTTLHDKCSQTTDSRLPFARAKVGSFFQAQPELGNQFLEDVTLQKYLRRHMPNEVAFLLFVTVKYGIIAA